MATKYTCPMHPEVIQEQPGDCPKCGMSLEAVTTDENKEENDELSNMSKRFWISLFLSFPVFLSAMASSFGLDIFPKQITEVNLQWFEFLLSTPVVFWGGWPFFVRAYRSFLSRNLNMFTLISMGVSAAYGYSLVALFAPQIFPPLMLSEDGLVHLYFEASAVITTLVLLGQVLELKARSKTNSAIKSLLNLAPKQAHRIIDDSNTDEDVNIELIQIGDRLRIKPGEKIPVDGIVTEGQSYVDESMITGEAQAVSKSIDDTLIGATINKNGTLIMQAKKVGSDTMLAQIVDLVSKAQRSRAPIQQLADTVSGYFVPAVIISAVLASFSWLLFGPEPRLAYALVSAVSVLIIACPCALGLATPISIMVGTAQAALSGILIKDAKTLESVHKIDTLVVDKTGTLTEGKPRITQIITQEGFSESEVLQYAASLEHLSEHPLAEAILAKAKENDIDILDVKNFQSFTAKGIEALVKDKKVILGNEKFMHESGVFIDLQKEKTDTKGVVFMAIDSKFCAMFELQDPIKQSSFEAIEILKNENIKVVILSGDNESTVQNVARKLGLDEMYANLMPQDKADIIRELQNKGAVVAMAGDGINDAPALAQADVAIAMGNGTDIAIESAGITLIKGDMMGIVKAIKLSRATMKNIKQNLFFAFVYNAIGVPIAAGVLYPFIGILLSPMIAATAMSFSSVSVIANALRLKNIKL